jgi:hypothetical protein
MAQTTLEKKEDKPDSFPLSAGCLSKGPRAVKAKALDNTLVWF